MGHFIPIHDVEFRSMGTTTIHQLVLLGFIKSLMTKNKSIEIELNTPYVLTCLPELSKSTVDHTLLEFKKGLQGRGPILSIISKQNKMGVKSRFVTAQHPELLGLLAEKVRGDVNTIAQKARDTLSQKEKSHKMWEAVNKANGRFEILNAMDNNSNEKVTFVVAWNAAFHAVTGNDFRSWDAKTYYSLMKGRNGIGGELDGYEFNYRILEKYFQIEAHPTVVDFVRSLRYLRSKPLPFEFDITVLAKEKDSIFSEVMA